MSICKARGAAHRPRYELRLRRLNSVLPAHDPRKPLSRAPAGRESDRGGASREGERNGKGKKWKGGTRGEEDIMSNICVFSYSLHDYCVYIYIYIYIYIERERYNSCS